MAKSFKSVMRGLVGNGCEQTAGNKALYGGAYLKSIDPEARRAARQMAHKALKEGMMVFMTKETVACFNKILKTTVTTSTMRRLLQEIGNGTLVLMAPPKTTVTIQRDMPATNIQVGGRQELPMQLSVEQLSGGLPFTLQQAARILNVKPQRLYVRCITGRMHFERNGKRYLIPANEVARLQVIGL